MGERNQEAVVITDSLEDLFEPALGDLGDDDLEELVTATSDKQRLAVKRRRAEERLEEKRMRDELGYYDLDFDDS